MIKGIILFLIITGAVMFMVGGSNDTIVINNANLNKFFDTNTVGEVGNIPFINFDGNALEVQSGFDFNKDTNMLTVNDFSANRVDTTTLGIKGNVEEVVTGALDFDGVDDYVDMSIFNGLNGVNQLAVSVWVYKEENGNFPSHDGIIGIGSAGQRMPWIWGVSGQQYLKAHIETLDGAVDCDLDSNVMTANAWTHVLLNWDGTTCQLYFNGVASGASDTTTGDTVVSSDGTNLIGRIDIYDNWNGLIDEVLIFNRSLNSTEISDLYNSGTGLYANTSVAPFNDGLVVGYHLDEGEGTIATDITGDNNGTINSGASWVDGIVEFDGLGEIIEVTRNITLNNDDLFAFEKGIQTNNSIKGIHKTADGTNAVADGTYTMGIGATTNGTITIKDGIIISVTEAVD